MSDTASQTKTSPKIKTSKMLFIRNDTETIIPPKKRDPVSPIKIFAGYKLNIKKPKIIPSKIPVIKPREIVLKKTSETNIKNKATVRETHPAKPSMPSVKFTLFTTPHKIKKAIT